MEDTKLKNAITALCATVRRWRELKRPEADTVDAVRRFFADGLGYDAVSEICREFPTDKNPCDIAVGVNRKNDRTGTTRWKMLVECKPCGTPLEPHVNQISGYVLQNKASVSYGILTDGIVWRLFCRTGWQRVRCAEILSVSLEGDTSGDAYLLFDAISRDGVIAKRHERIFADFRKARNAPRPATVPPDALRSALANGKVLAAVRDALGGDKWTDEVVRASIVSAFSGSVAAKGSSSDCDPVFICRNNGLVSKGRRAGEGIEFVVFAGSSVQPSKKCQGASARRAYSKIEGMGVVRDGKLTEDFTFTSPSIAGSVCTGGSYGKEHWFTEDGRSYDDVYQKV